MINPLVCGDTARAALHATVLVEGAVNHAIERQTRMMWMPDDQLRTDATVPRDVLEAELARRARLAPRARTREEREFGRAA